MRKATSNSNGKMPLRNDTFFEVMPEAAEEDLEVTLRTQAQLHERTFTQRDWPLQSPLLHPRIEGQPPNGGFVFELEGAEHASDQKNRSGKQEASANSLEIQVEKTVAIHQASVSIPDAFKFPPLNKRRKRQSVAQSELKRKSASMWRFWIPKPFATPDSLDVQKPVTSHNQMSPSANPAKVLLLGSSCSGKSTILKSIAQACEDCWTPEARLSFKEIIFSNTVQSMQVILEAMESLEMPLEDSRNEYHVQTIFMQPAQNEEDYLDVEVCIAIEGLWMDSGVKAAFERSNLVNEYQLNDSAA